MEVWGVGVVLTVVGFEGKLAGLRGYIEHMTVMLKLDQEVPFQSGLVGDSRLSTEHVHARNTSTGWANLPDLLDLVNHGLHRKTQSQLLLAK